MTNEVTHTICPECSLCFTPDSYDILIKRLVADNDRLREALQSIVNSGPASPGDKKHEIAKAALIGE